MHELVEKFISMVQANQHVEAVEHFYAEDASIRDNQSEERGKSIQLENEKQLLSKIKKMYSHCVRTFFVHDNIVVIKWHFRFEFKNDTYIEIEEVAYQHWDKDQILSEQFFFDPKQFIPQPL